MTRRWLGLVVVFACNGGGGGDGSTGSSTGDATAPSTSTALTTSPPADGSSEPGDTTSAPTTGEPPAGSSGAGTTTTAGDTGDTGTTTGEPVVDVPVFLAQGHLGRTTISCDDGHTWIHDQSVDDAARCFEDGLDCDHHAYAGRGVAWGDGAFVLAWGWGHPGTLVRSDDAATFSVVMTDTPTFADVAFGAGRFVANNSTTAISVDLGEQWGPGGPLDIGINTRAIEFVAQDAGWFIVAGESGDQRAVVRSPDGVTWTPATTRPPECGAYTLGMAHGTGVTVMASGHGHVCTSPDGGDNWTYVPISERLTSPPLWTGGEFFVYEGGVVHRSPDGAAWSSTPLVGDGVVVGPLARSPEGTFVAANDGWMVWYDQQKFYRSSDGVTWDTLAAGTFTGGHPIYFMAHGRVKPGAGCPG
ncbi:MAG: hypothetical protein JNL82_27755 [Myxococcales bacterium]|nr:hypothetical protein [Myxococcales bacterium]